MLLRQALAQARREPAAHYLATLPGQASQACRWPQVDRNTHPANYVRRSAQDLSAPRRREPSASAT